MRNATLLATVLLLAALPSSAAELEWKGTLLVQLAVKDLDRSLAFYTEVLGWELISRNDELHWAKLRPIGCDAVVGVGESPRIEGSGTASLNFGVIDVDAARAVLESRGVVFSGETRTIPGVVRLADFADPDGNRFRLAQALE
ncbi:MAG TPA: VOC family protein [Candidatus Polarisedimenticolaceae bacterium]|nr:VOC family protein [Candidatus Polarisedimenticolaceae bacterium]